MDTIFELLFAKYGCWDYVIWDGSDPDKGYYRWRCYHDSGWLEGYDFEPVIYWDGSDPDKGYYRWRCYHDSGWLEGYDFEPVIYWGA